MRQKSRNGVIIVLLVIILLLAAVVAGMLWFINSHTFINGKPYPTNAQVLDLRDQKLTIGEYETIRQTLPDCEIRWSVPFQNGRYPQDSRELTVTALSDQDLELLMYFPNLEAVQAHGCQDYAHLEALRQQYPHLRVNYTVTIDGQEYPQDARAITVSALTDADIEMVSHLWDLEEVDAAGCRDYAHLAALWQIHPELRRTYQVEVLGQTLTQEDTEASFDRPNADTLMTELAYAPNLEKVHLTEPEGSAESLTALLEAYPDIDLTWDKTVLNQTFSSTQTEFDFSKIPFTSTDPVEEAMAYFPNAEKVIMSDCGIDNETMAAFREKMRQDYKVVWTVYVTRKPIRTDATIIHSSAMKVCLIDEQSYDLKYCEDAVVVDIGHSYVKYIEWIRYMPNVKYLILTHNWIKDLTPISTCKNLEYLELYWNDHIPDYSPLEGCTALKDLNVSGTFADPSGLHGLTWLDNLWANATSFTAQEIAELKEALPNTHIETTGGGYTQKGWRQLQSYYDMRDLMGLPYNTW